VTDRVDEVTLPEGILRIELDSVEVDGSGRIAASLNGEQISKERAEELIERGRRRRTRRAALPADVDALFEEFIRLLTTDSPHQDRRRRDFN